jgi:hypothetical protein
MDPLKILDAASGESSEFRFADNSLTYKLVIVGTAGANIKAFTQEKDKETNGFFIKIKCSNWNGASISLHSKTAHEDDDFSSTGDEFVENTTDIGEVIVYDRCLSDVERAFMRDHYLNPKWKLY